MLWEDREYLRLLKGAETVLIYNNLGCTDPRLANKYCLIHGNIKFTYKEFTEQVDGLALRLATEVKKGDRVLLKISDPVAQLMYFFGIIKAGGSCVFIDASASEELCTELIGLHNISLYINESFLLPSVAAVRLPDIQPEDIFLGALSSGSTGKPKLIWRDHISWTSAFTHQSKTFNLCSADTLFLVGALVYTANLNACLHMFSLGGTVVIAANGRPRTWLQEIMAYKVNAIFMVPANYKMLIKVFDKPLPWVKSIVAGGAKMDLHIVQQLVEYFPKSGIYEYYGASELGHVSYMATEDLLVNPRSVGKPFPGVKAWIEDDIIWVESPYLAPAYRPRATVGDLGRLDAAGNLYVLGRKNGLINSGGVKIIPEQVETVLCQCPGVSQAVVDGIDDDIKGQRVCAWVVKTNPVLTAVDILSFCRTKLRRHYCPQKIIFVEELPLNTNGKIDKLRLKEEL